MWFKKIKFKHKKNYTYFNALMLMLGLLRRLFDLELDSPDIDIFDPFGLSVANESEKNKFET